MSNKRSDLDEDDVRVRAGRSSRPRTRRRPAHESALEAFVISVDRGRYGCVLGDGARAESDESGSGGSGGLGVPGGSGGLGVPGGSGGPGGSGPGDSDSDSGQGRLLVAMKARELGKGSVVVGDRVALAGDISGSTGSLARIVRVAERTSVLRRSPDDTDPLERIIVANADQMVIVCALADPATKTRFVDRCLVAAYDAGLEPLLVLTKSDLAAPRLIRAFYRPLGIPMLTTRQPLPAQTLSRLRKALDGRISVLIGQSGVGKSSLVNALVPDAGRAVGRVNAVTGKGRHTSSSAIALRLPDDSGWLIDTPGVRGFGLGHVTPDRVVDAFGDLAEGTAGCPPGCDHLSPGCALDRWAADHDATARLESLRRLLRSRESPD